MPISDSLKNDIRVRDRLLRKNELTESEIERQDAALLDVEDKAVVLELKQPALQKESERAIDGPRISRPAPAQRPAPIRPFEEEDDDDDEVLDPKAKVKPVPVAAAALLAAVASVDDEDEDDEDDEDEDDEDEDVVPAEKKEEGEKP